MLLVGAHGFVVIHNHPSGDVTPSAEDIRTYKIVRGIGDLMEVPCLDFLIVGKKTDGGNMECFSFWAKGLMNDAVIVDIKTERADNEKRKRLADSGKLLSD